jgi:glycine hydroxymethyltransferase
VAEQDLSDVLLASVRDQERMLRSTLILNPVENVPFPEDIAVAGGLLHGLYNSDKPRNREQRLLTPMQFAGRQELESDSRRVYDAFAQALGAEDATLRLLSGLHAHIVFFMAAAQPGQKVLALPVEAGGHVSGKAILERLGLNVIDMATDRERMCVDVTRTLEISERERPDFLFVDRSEGLIYEDFSSLARAARRTVFDGSQYLTNIISGDHQSPFAWGFDLLLASVHKNFPGPQKALLATRLRDPAWTEVLAGISTFVSNMHVASTYAAGLTLARRAWLSQYSRGMLDCAVALEAELGARGVPVVKRAPELVPTHHVWIREASREAAFECYERLEECRIMTNFRLLPYGLGFGIRLGLSAAARLGLTTADIPRLAELIATIRKQGARPELQHEARRFNEILWQRALSGQALDRIP